MEKTKKEVKNQKAKVKNATQKSKVETKAVEKNTKSIMKNGKKTMKRTLTGTVVSAKMQNTVVVAIERKVAHKVYRKLIKVTKRIKADSNGMELKEGERVKIEATRPISRDKNFKVIGKEEARE
jgi:small subunit ribosomal protein S17